MNAFKSVRKFLQNIQTDIFTKEYKVLFGYEVHVNKAVPHLNNHNNKEYKEVSKTMVDILNIIESHINNKTAKFDDFEKAVNVLYAINTVLENIIAKDEESWVPEFFRTRSIVRQGLYKEWQKQAADLLKLEEIQNVLNQNKTLTAKNSLQ